MPQISISEDDFNLFNTPDEQLLLGIEPSIEDCDGGPCGAPELQPGPHWHLRITASGIGRSYVRFVSES